MGLGEIAFRLPALIAGLALVVLAPLWVRDIVGKQAADALAWLLAVAPLLVFHSRWARPYAIALLLATLGMLAAWRWRRGAGNRWAWGYGCCAVLGSWFLPPFIPVLFAPLAFLLGESLVRPGIGRSPWAVLGLAAGVLAGLAMLLIPPWVVDAQSLDSKMGRSAIELSTIGQAFKLYTGTHRAGFQLGVAVAAATGIATTLLRTPAFCTYLGFVLGCQGLALALAEPHMIDSGATFGRYMLPALVVLLLFVAVALGELDRIAGRLWGGHAAPLFGAIGALVLLSCGPLPAIHTRPNNWTNHSDFQDTYDPAARVLRYEEWGRRQEAPAGLLRGAGGPRARQPLDRRDSLVLPLAAQPVSHVPAHPSATHVHRLHRNGVEFEA